VRANAIRLTKEKYGSAGDNWLPEFESQCVSCFQQYEAERSLFNRGPGDLQQLLNAQQDSGDVRFTALPSDQKQAYLKVLRLLQVGVKGYLMTNNVFICVLYYIHFLTQ
jgi:hypothetical protein